jgi:hypothetical protein
MTVVSRLNPDTRRCKAAATPLPCKAAATPLPCKAAAALLSTRRQGPLLPGWLSALWCTGHVGALPVSLIMSGVFDTHSLDRRYLLLPGPLLQCNVLHVCPKLLMPNRV